MSPEVTLFEALDSIPASSNCLACGIDKGIADHREKSNEPYCDAMCKNRAQEACSELESVLSTRTRFKAGILGLKQLPDFPFHIIQRLASTHPTKLTRAKLTKLADQLPPDLFLKNVYCDFSYYKDRGGFGEIFVGEYKGELVAVKRINPCSRLGWDEEKTKKNFYREALLWNGLDHPHILPFYGLYSGEARQMLYMVSPWMELGNIRTVIERSVTNKVSGEARVHLSLVWCHEVSMGLEYLHKNKIVHGDLRSVNILVDKEGHARISDFGLSVIADAESGELSSIRGGNVRWLAPEVILPNDFGLDSTRPTTASDIYSFSCLCVEIFTGDVPFKECISNKYVSDEVLKGTRPKRPEALDGIRIPDSFWGLLNWCWEHQRGDRPEAHVVVEFIAREFSSEMCLGTAFLQTANFLPSDSKILVYSDVVSIKEVETGALFDAPTWKTASKILEPTQSITSNPDHRVAANQVSYSVLYGSPSVWRKSLLARASIRSLFCGLSFYIDKDRGSGEKSKPPEAASAEAVFVLPKTIAEDPQADWVLVGSEDHHTIPDSELTTTEMWSSSTSVYVQISR